MALGFQAVFRAPQAALVGLYWVIVAIMTHWRQNVEEVFSPNRRRFLTESRVALIGASSFVFFEALVRDWWRATRAAQPGELFAFTPPPPRSPAFAIPDLTPEVTPVADFYVMSKNTVDPVIDAESWQLLLSVPGQGERIITYDELRGLPRTDQYVTLRCVSNDVSSHLMGTALWSGVRLRDLVSKETVPSSIAEVAFIGAEGHSDSLPLEGAFQDDVLIAYGMNGRTLDRDHGFPARLLVPGYYGFKNVKWLTEIRFVTGPYSGTWPSKGWAKEAVVKTMSRIDLVKPGSGGALVAGIAYAGRRGVRSVEVRVNGSEWMAAEMHEPPLSALTWVQWKKNLRATGRIATEARATDHQGGVQSEIKRSQFPDGATGLHAREFEI
jgi:DMSO/TMAO reductase YedYZ molybdopterin-dependent catalytic subunit